MPTYYLDTSALLKRYWAEQGAEVVTELMDRPASDDRLVTSFLTVLEMTSTAYRLMGSGEMPVSVGQEILRRFHRDLDEHFVVWPLDNVSVARAVGVVEQYRLRSADAIHLATALAIAPEPASARVVVVSADRELCRAARAASLNVLDPLDDHAAAQLAAIRSTD